MTEEITFLYVTCADQHWLSPSAWINDGLELSCNIWNFVHTH